jgi:hypothetical protein
MREAKKLHGPERAALIKRVNAAYLMALHGPARRFPHKVDGGAQ